MHRASALARRSRPPVSFGSGPPTPPHPVATVLFVLGALWLLASLAMALTGLLGFALGEPSAGRALTIPAAAVAVLGSGLLLTTRPEVLRLTIRQTFAVTVGAWVSIGAIGALPLWGGPAGLALHDALFESYSGLTTTGSTVIVDLDRLPAALHFWRGMLEWLGGIGIIALGLAILPWLRVGGMQLFRQESSDRSDKALPRVVDFVRGIGVVYLGFTVATGIALFLAGLPAIEAAVHAMTALSTGGFSTENASVGAYDSPTVEWILTVAMIAGALPFVRYVSLLRGNPGPLLQDPQIRGFLLLLATVWGAMTLYLVHLHTYPWQRALAEAAFNTTSVITTTGYASTDYQLWGPTAMAAFLLLMMLGGCTGSTSGGFKMFRLQALFVLMQAQVERLYAPRTVREPTWDGRRIDPAMQLALVSFLAVFGAGILLVTLALAATGLDLLTALSGAITAICNVGPGLGDIIGPAGNFAPLDPVAKIILIVAMLFGRLEFFTILVLFAPGFWRW